MLENASFVHVFGCMCMLELTIKGWWIIVAYLSIPNWFELQIVSQLASYLFSYFLLRSLLPFSNSKFFLISCVVKMVHDNYTVLTAKQLDGASLQLLAVYLPSNLFGIPIRTCKMHGN